MSWMDSWSRPSKHAVTPPPLYLTNSGEGHYCHSCGRIIGSRKTQSGQEVKYCSSRCRTHKPGPLDRKIESAFASLLDGRLPEWADPDSEAAKAALSAQNQETANSKKKKKKDKGDPRIVVDCSTVQDLVFGSQKDPSKVFGRKKNRAARGVVENPEDWRSVDMADEDPEPTRNDSATEGAVELAASDGSTLEDDDGGAGGVVLESAEGYGGGKVRPPQTKSDVNGSVGGEKGWAERSEETEDMKAKRKEGQRRAEEKEMVKRAARRGCAFGFVVQGENSRDTPFKSDAKVDGEVRKKCEAVMKGVAVEASFAKGEWGIRWREDV